MNVTIQVNDGNSATPLSAVGTTQGASTATSDNIVDAGAPKAGNFAGGSNISASDITDIGGPPAWLLAALDKRANARTSASQLNAAAADAQDAGGAPST